MKINKKIITGAVFASIIAMSTGVAGCSGIFPTEGSKEDTVESASISETVSETENTDISTEQRSYTIYYYIDDETKEPSDKVTEVKYGEKTPVLKISELGFSKEGRKFTGWKVYRESDDTWYLKNTKDNKNSWIALNEGKLPDGYEYSLHQDGEVSVKAAENGAIKLFGTWEDEKKQ